MIRVRSPVKLAMVALFGAGCYLAGYYNGKQHEDLRLAVAKSAIRVEPVQAVVAPPPLPPVCKDWAYVVPAKGDHVNSLTRVAEQVYGGRGYLYPLIAETNGIEFPFVIHPGQSLTIKACFCGLPTLPAKVKKVPRVAQTATVVKKQVVTEVVQPTTTEPPASPRKVETTVSSEVSTLTTPDKVLQPEKESVGENETKRTIAVIEPSTPVRRVRGTMWNLYSVGPLDNKDKIDQLHADAGLVTAHFGKTQLEIYAGLNATRDNRGRQRYNTESVEAGLRLVRVLKFGFIEFAGAYGLESRQQVGRGVMGQTNFGFVLTTRGQLESSFKTLPARAEWSLGNTSPWKSRSVVGDVRLEQGVTVAKVKVFYLIPDVWSGLRFDSNDPGNTWATYGGGARLAFPWSRGVIDFKAGYECASAQNSNSARVCGPTGKAEFRYKIGGADVSRNGGK